VSSVRIACSSVIIAISETRMLNLLSESARPMLIVTIALAVPVGMGIIEQCGWSGLVVVALMAQVLLDLLIDEEAGGDARRDLEQIWPQPTIHPCYTLCPNDTNNGARC